MIKSIIKITYDSYSVYNNLMKEKKTQVPNKFRHIFEKFFILTN